MPRWIKIGDVYQSVPKRGPWSTAHYNEDGSLPYIACPRCGAKLDLWGKWFCWKCHWRS